jgi:hypothetical protein
MRLQVELTGYTKTRESATIYEVGRDVIPSSEARRTIGADAEVLHLAQDGNYVLVKATLPGRTFHAEHRTYQYHQGLPAKTEVRVESKRFLITLIPSLEKYVE